MESKPIKTIVVLEFDLPDPEAVASIVRNLIAPPPPHWTGTVRVSIGDVAHEVIRWLDET